MLHVLNRLGYGPRPADVARVRQMGVAAYLEQQLDLSRASDTAAAEAVSGYDVLTATTAQLVRDYPQPTPQQRQAVAQGDTSRREMRQMLPAGRRPAAITTQLQAAAITRAVASDAQLAEVLTAFWFNHFNVYSQKGAVRWMVPAYEREAIRPHVLGKFRDLVLATARHPAMLFYLDNWMSTRDGLVRPRGTNAGRPMGLNENYARELMELHTLGVDGGYTQQDVTEVARVLHRLDDRSAARGRPVPVPADGARPRQQARARARDSRRRRRGRRRARDRHPGAPSLDGALHRHQAGAALRHATIRPPRWSIAWRRRSARPTATFAR